ncbi:class I adenylate-forming enzyme family protein [Haliangium ochraceum]|uniref:AMP-dependent synthetase and ligase n=1 Tax=Haliangium ochraceum (strain DSM 14365 / JCM 11303 / SMP-2) TaxID=502025 RepID=D0LJ55_HALO1|nr:class I adenylate-forming enzyme family protein [Haliangium ochraceum]ACY14902.1 AMP-dependent synthetase and ligase [Haliangium ochraceum DSM 14365]
MTLLYDWLKTVAKSQGSSKALVYRDNYLSWRGLLHRVDRRAKEFQSMGIEEGAWVGLMLGNVPDFVILALALAKLNATVVPIDPTTGSRELELVLAAAPLRALITRPRGSEGSITATGATGPTRPRNRREDEEDPDEIPEIRRRLQGTLLTCSVFKRPSPELDTDPLTVMFTADSLGDPKGVLRVAENMAATVDNLVEALSIDKSSRILVAVPLFHAYGWDLGLLPVLRTGATMYLEEEISAKRVAKLLREHSIDVLPGTPTMYTELIRLPTAKPLKLKNTRYLAGGSKLATDVADGFYDKYGIRLVACYHSTEAGVISVDRTAKSPKSVGKVIPGIEVQVTDDDGTKLATGKPGLIWVRGASVSALATGPFEDEEDAEAGGPLVPIGNVDNEGWFRTGDTGVLERNGRLSLTGREDHMVKVEGKRVSLDEVEGCLESFPNIKGAEARVVTDPLTGAMVVARVATDLEVDAEEIIDYCARNLAPYKVPRRIELCKEL